MDGTPEEQYFTINQDLVYEVVRHAHLLNSNAIFEDRSRLILTGTFILKD